MSLAVNDVYVTQAPSAQNALDLFKGVWASQLPEDGLQSGATALFDDVRLHWLLEQCGGVKGKTVLELGPLEGGHTYMLERAGASSITAIEANSLAYLRCLIVKEVFSLRSARFLLGDFDKFLSQTASRYDLIVASGVLYHLTDPLATLQNMARLADKIFIWSHFFDEAAMPAGDERLAPFTGETVKRELGGDTLTYHLRSYGDTPLPKNFCGGIMSGSIWVEKMEVIALLERHNYSVSVHFEQDTHAHGPSACLYASRR